MMFEPEPAKRIGAVSALVFVTVAAFLLWIHGNRLVLNNDEGIILDASERMLQGQTIYRDFFGYMSPGSYWIQEAVFGIFGVSLRSGRVIVILDFALQCAILFWLTALLAGKRTGLAATGLFFTFQATMPDLLLAQHRMDSASMALLSIALSVQGQRCGRYWYWVAAGLLGAAAAVCTPSIGLIAVTTMLWLSVEPSLRRFLKPYSLGLCAVALAALGALWATGTLSALIEQLAWLGQNYSEVNYMPYGSIISGYTAALGGATGVALGVRALLLFGIALPAVLPVVATAAWGTSWLPGKRDPRRIVPTPVVYLLGCMAMFVAGTYPRSDVAHLAFVAVLPYALTAAWLSQRAPRQLAAGAFMLLAVVAVALLAQRAHDMRDEETVSTPVGTLRASSTDAPGLRRFLETVRPGGTLYVHPYKPMLYFLAQAHNPTRYSYLAPGLMNGDDEAAALRNLENQPPEALMYQALDRSEYLRVFPHGWKLNHRFPRIEDWIAREYVPVEPPVYVGGYRLYERARRTAPGFDGG